MHIKLKNKKLVFGKYKVKCSIGKRGISKSKKEGDYCTPKGKFNFLRVFYRRDRVKNISSNIRKRIINKDMGWCDDPTSNNYNKLVKLPFKRGCEKLYKKNNVYDVIIVISYNLKPIIKNKGSAIFLHIATKQYSPTKGCIAVSKKDMFLLLSFIKKKTKIIIN